MWHLCVCMYVSAICWIIHEIHLHSDMYGIIIDSSVAATKAWFNLCLISHIAQFIPVAPAFLNITEVPWF